MFDLTDVESVRKPLECLCRTPASRTNPPHFDIAHRWHPFSVQHPATMSRFNDAAAWELIADCLKGGVAIRCQAPTAQFPDHAYVMIEAPDGFDRKIYMKIAIRLGVKRILGISFHYA